MIMHDHLQFMSQAVALAAKGRDTVSPNPMVGCVIVRDQQIIGQGYHQYSGGPHAEVIALQQAGSAAKGATAYVTLEPCCHQGKTPPCTLALIAAGIKKVVIACIDPNPLVQGKGVASLRAAGIEVHAGVQKEEAEKLNEIFFHYMRTKQPFVIAKWAMSLDGKTVVNQDDDRGISGNESLQHAHQLRQQCDAILVGATTVLDDNPKLTARPANPTYPIRQPLRIILAGQNKLPANAQIFNDDGQTIIAITTHNQHLYEGFPAVNTEFLLLPANEQCQVSLPALLTELGRRGITSLLVEGGMTTHHHFFKEDLVNRVHAYLAPTVIASHASKQFYQDMTIERLGSDYLFSVNAKETRHV